MRTCEHWDHTANVTTKIEKFMVHFALQAEYPSRPTTISNLRNVMRRLFSYGNKGNELTKVVMVNVRLYFTLVT